MLYAALAPDNESVLFVDRLALLRVYHFGAREYVYQADLHVVASVGQALRVRATEAFSFDLAERTPLFDDCFALKKGSLSRELEAELRRDDLYLTFNQPGTRLLVREQNRVYQFRLQDGYNFRLLALLNAPPAPFAAHNALLHNCEGLDARAAKIFRQHGAQISTLRAPPKKNDAHLRAKDLIEPPDELQNLSLLSQNAFELIRTKPPADDRGDPGNKPDTGDNCALF